MVGIWMPETCREEKQTNILNGIVHPVGLIYETLCNTYATARYERTTSSLTLSFGNRKWIHGIRAPRQVDYATAQSPSRQTAQQTDNWYCETNRSVFCYHIKFY